MLDSPPRYIGLDPMPIADRVPGPHYIKAVGEFLPLRNNFASTALSIQTLDHTLYPEKLLKEIGRILLPEGLGGIEQGIHLRDSNNPKDILMNFWLKSFGKRKILGYKSKCHLFNQKSLIDLFQKSKEGYYDLTTMREKNNLMIRCKIRKESDGAS